MRINEYKESVENLKLSKDQYRNLINRIDSAQKRKPVCRRLRLNAICSVLLVSAILISSVAALKILVNKEPRDLQDPPLTNVSDETTEQVDITTDKPIVTDPDTGNIPDWYKPGSLVVNTIKMSGVVSMSASAGNYNISYLGQSSAKTIKTDTGASKSTEIELPKGLEFSGSLNATLLEVKATSGEHKGCSGLLYNTETGETLCLTHMFKNAAAAAGKSYSHISLMYYQQDIKAAIFYASNNNGTKFKHIFFDIVKNTVNEIPATLDLLGFLISSDFHYIYFNDVDYSVDGFNVYRLNLMDMEKGKEIISNVDGNSNGIALGISFSPEKKIIYYKIMNANRGIDKGADARWGIYNTETGNKLLIKGDIIRFADNDKIVAVQTADGVKLFDTYTGAEVSDTSRLQSYEQYSTEVNNKTLLSGGVVYTITLKPYLDSTKSTITVAKNVSNYLIEGDYVYTYVDGEDHLSVYTLNTFESFTVDVNETFLNTIERLKNNYVVNYIIAINNSKTRILLTYVTSLKSQENVDYKSLIYEAFPKSDSMDDLYEIINFGCKNSDQFKATMYKGEGYNYLIINCGSYVMAAVEDYRDRTFTLYKLGLNYGYNGSEFIYGMFDICSYPDTKPNYEKYRRKLHPEASNEKTLSMFDFINVKNAFIDYAEFYHGDILDADKIFNYVNSPDYILKYMTTTNAMIYNDNTKNIFRQIIQIAGAQDLKVYSYPDIEKLFGDYYVRSSTATHLIVCQYYYEVVDRYTHYYFFAVGISTEGKKYVKHNGKFAYIDDATYNKLCDLCSKLK